VVVTSELGKGKESISPTGDPREEIKKKKRKKRPDRTEAEATESDLCVKKSKHQGEERERLINSSAVILKNPAIVESERIIDHDNRVLYVSAYSKHWPGKTSYLAEGDDEQGRKWELTSNPLGEISEKNYSIEKSTWAQPPESLVMVAKTACSAFGGTQGTAMWKPLIN